MSSQLKVQELRDALEERGLDVSGTKAVLVARLEAYEKDKTSKKRDAPAVNDAPSNQGKKAKTDPKGSSVQEDIDGSSVAELRTALAKRGLSTAGAKKALHSRLSEALLADSNDKDADENDACPSNHVEKDKESKESITEEDIDGFTVAEFRSALAERGLATGGSKKILHSRLSGALKATKPADSVKDTDEDEGKGSDGKEQEKEEKLVVLTKKGGAVLDNHLPDDIKARFHVLETNQGIYDAMLNQTNVGDNNNKFYVIQVLESDGGGGQYYVYNRWGRVGARGQDKLFGIFSKDSAISEFEAKFYDKTKNSWTQRSSFQPVKSKYTWLERDYSSDDSAEPSDSKAKSINKTPSIPKTPKESKLESRLAQFISCICSISMMKQQMMEIGYDANKMPLGKLSKATILKGYEALKQIATVLDGTTKGSLERLSSDFYTVIPHDFGFKRMSNFIIDTHGKLKKKLEMVEALGEIQLATKLLQEEEEEDDPVYSSYERLKCHLEPLEHNCEEFNWVALFPLL